MTINAPSQQLIFLIPQGCETLRPTHDEPRISERIGKLRQYRSQGESIALCKKVDIFHRLGSHPLQIRRYNPITNNFLTKQTGWQETSNREKKWAWFHKRNSTASTVKMIALHATDPFSFLLSRILRSQNPAVNSHGRILPTRATRSHPEPSNPLFLP